jgi:hypothetical protein
MSEIEQNEGEARSYHRWQFRLGALGILNGWSRRVDDFALRLTRAPGPFIGAMERLAGLNRAERNPIL